MNSLELIAVEQLKKVMEKITFDWDNLPREKQDMGIVDSLDELQVLVDALYDNYTIEKE